MFPFTNIPTSTLLGPPISEVGDVHGVIWGLIQLCNELKSNANRSRQNELAALDNVASLKRDIRVIQAELANRNDALANAKARFAKESRAEVVALESHHLATSELHRRLTAEHRLANTLALVAGADAARDKAREERDQATRGEREAKDRMEEAERREGEWRAKVELLEFSTSDAQASAIKSLRRIEELEGDVSTLLSENASTTTLLASTSAKLEETERELDEQRVVGEDLREQVVEGNRRLTTLTASLHHVTSLRASLADRTRVLELQLARRTAELDEMKQRVQDTVKEYEQKIERMEEEVWAAKAAAGQAAAVRLPMSASASSRLGMAAALSASPSVAASAVGSRAATPTPTPTPGRLATPAAAAGHSGSISPAEGGGAGDQQGPDTAAVSPGSPSSSPRRASSSAGPTGLPTATETTTGTTRLSTASASATARSIAAVDTSAMESAAAALADMESRFAEKERAYAAEVARLRQDVGSKGAEVGGEA
ncbi:hypothetical protein HDU93_006860 [Gonapodya sp. JEL0774]|nr:hypothetical protein HDU93_006860 [Gonapodya sp. JEL0774]